VTGAALALALALLVLPPSARPRLVALQMVRMRGSALSLATFMGPFEAEFCHGHGTTWLPVMGTPGVSCRAVLAGAAAQRASVLIAGPLGLCYLPTFLCLGIVPVVAGLAGDVLGPGRM
jgi:hypothetical protein